MSEGDVGGPLSRPPHLAGAVFLRSPRPQAFPTEQFEMAFKNLMGRNILKRVGKEGLEEAGAVESRNNPDY